MGKMTKGREGAVVLLVAVALYFWASFALGGPTDAPRINEIKQGTHESLWDFMGRFGTSFEAQIFYALFASGVAGSVSSFLWKWSQDMVNWNHWSAKYVVGQLLWLAGISVAAIATVGFQTESGEFYGWLSVLWSGGFAGFSGEVKIKSKWTPEQQAESREHPGVDPKA